MELPDFQAKIYVTGTQWPDGTLHFVEQSLLLGSQHSGWMLRHGTGDWQPGTQYELTISGSHEDSPYGNNGFMSGLLTSTATIGPRNLKVLADVTVQREQLWLFDPKMHAPSISLSNDSKSATATRPERCCAFGNVGFSGGVHYWEIKVEQADAGSLFIGIAEKDYPPGYGRPQKMNRWFGYGFINYRATLHMTTERVYGEHFHAGDTIGVLLDLERGQMSFFMDGMKYGQHILIDLGSAFDSLRTKSPRIRPRTFFPVVGFYKTGDRVTLSPRWISSIEQSPTSVLKDIDRTCNMLRSWGQQPSASSSHNDEAVHRSDAAAVARLPEWLYNEASIDWNRWRANRYRTINTRLKRCITVEVCTSPVDCAFACARLGLSQVLFCGDRFSLSRSNGRVLEQREEGVILGEYDAKLWYRLDAQRTEGGSAEDASLAWFLAPHDVESLELVKPSTSVPESLRALPRPKKLALPGGNIRVIYEYGAVMRNGLEIDVANKLETVP
ncbi:MAG: SPRY domain-containing protein, partial [Anaerolineales bacterium]